MSKKALVGLLSLVVSALSNAPVHANGAFTHMYIAQKSLEQVQDQEIRNVILRNIEAYYLGANFPDVGYLGKYLGQASSGKAYGEGTHWDEFLDAYKRALFKLYRHPMTENPMAFSFIMGVATHRVSDDIWHYDGNSSSYQFKTCDKSTSPFCYYGFILKLADLEGLPWADAHQVADKGVEFAVIIDKKLPANLFPNVTAQNVPFEIVVNAFKDPVMKKSWDGFSDFDKVTVEDLAKDFAAYTVVNIALYSTAGAGLAAEKIAHTMDWARNNYESDPDVGLNAIEAHVAKFISTLGTSLK